MSALTPETLAALRAPILRILRASDLKSISAKKVRTQLADSGLLGQLGVNVEEKLHKSALDDEIRGAFALLDAERQRNGAAPLGNAAAAAAAQPASSSAPAVQQGIALPGLGRRGDSSSTSITSSAPTIPHRVKAEQDAQMAARLQKQYDAESGPSTRRSNGTSSSSGGGKRKKSGGVSKSDDVISSEEEVGVVGNGSSSSGSAKKRKSSSGTKSGKKKEKELNADGTEKAKNPNNPFNRPVLLSPAMADICGGDEMPRYEITKKLWQYIKANSLQNPTNGREILCDAKLTDLFGKSKVDSFAMAKLVSQHVRRKEDL
ncbi:SWIB-domain-containing protein [Ceraceosorus guamensis]|uniref:SWIB-domain-containing protein n=1 Tax=Ceraceosorus guamensis TaxID=1522189 RepID=A0A316VVF1_9BASI|nr:SWIB-domain-containing protein [Ceraceosorus guamensis]PWN41460.1 SWIB-domain-containing protein [Ceraceosorus guamensis]